MFDTNRVSYSGMSNIGVSVGKNIKKQESTKNTEFSVEHWSLIFLSILSLSGDAIGYWELVEVYRQDYESKAIPLSKDQHWLTNQHWAVKAGNSHHTVLSRLRPLEGLNKRLSALVPEVLEHLKLHRFSYMLHKLQGHVTLVLRQVNLVQT